jgi:excisionase family DNA binding protein
MTVLTVEQAAERLHVSPRAVRDYITKGKLPASRLGRRWLIQETRLEERLGAPLPANTEEG